MSLSAELKDFTGGFKSSFDMYTRYKREKDLADYRKAKIADSQPSPGFGGDGGGGASSGATGGAKLSTAEQQQTARKIYSSLLDKGYNTNAAAGITGNLWHESGGFGGGSGDSGTAHGIAQWRGDRWTKMQAYAKSVGKDPNDLNTQVDYLDKELKTDYKSAYNLLQHATDVKTATGIFADQYEKPAGSGKGNIAGISGMSNRLNFATQVSNFGGGAIGTSKTPIVSRVKALSTSPQASLGSTPPAVSTASSSFGAAPPEAQLAEDTTSSATGDDDQVASNDQQDADQDVQGAARGGLIKGYADGGKVSDDDFIADKGINTAFNPVFRKSLLDLQKRATAAGIKTHLISGVRTLDDQKELYANFLAGQAGKPLPYPKRGAVALAAKPGTSPHEKGMAADLAVDDPRDRGRLIELSKSDPNLRHIADDPNHFELNTKGGDDAPAVASTGTVPPPPPDVPEEDEEDLAEPVAGAAQPEERDQGNAQGLADATERGRANQAYMASEAAYGHQRLLQEGQTNEQALGQEAAARSTPPPPAQDQSQGAARGGLIRGYAPGGVVDATGYIAPNTASLSSATQALAPAVAAASQATPASPVSTPAVSTTTAAPAAAATSANSGSSYVPTKSDVDSYNTQMTAWRQNPTGAQPVNPVSNSPVEQLYLNQKSDWNNRLYSAGRNYNEALSSGRGQNQAQQAWNNVGPQPMDPMVTMQNASASPAAAPAIPPVTGTDRGSVWNPTTKSWEAGAGYTYDQGTKSWVPAAGSNAAKQGYAGGGTVRGYADGGDVDDEDGAVPDFRGSRASACRSSPGSRACPCSTDAGW